MKKPQINPANIAPATITYINGKAQVHKSLSPTQAYRLGRQAQPINVMKAICQHP